MTALAPVSLASSPGSLLKNGRGGERREPGNIRGKSCWHLAPCSGGTNQIAERNTCTHDILYTQQKIVNSRWTYKRRLHLESRQKNSFWMCGRGASPKSPRSKFTVVGLQDQLSHHTSQLRVYTHKVLHGTQQSCGCLEDEERNCK